MLRGCALVVTVALLCEACDLCTVGAMRSDAFCNGCVCFMFMVHSGCGGLSCRFTSSCVMHFAVMACGGLYTLCFFGAGMVLMSPTTYLFLWPDLVCC